MALKVIKTVRVSPATNSSSDSVDSFNLPLTFFDLRWLKFQPIQRVIFYKLTEPTRESFYSLILPKLELSLSLVLHHYLPIAGRLVWDPQDPKPYISVSKHDTMSLTVAETNADFFLVSGNGLRPAIELHPLVSELTVSDDSASLFSLQITLFPNQGICIGFTVNHAFLDGKSSAMFIKSWAHICRLEEHNQVIDFPLLPNYLTPSFDRTVINVQRELESKTMELLLYLSKDSGNFKSLKPPPISEMSSDVVRATLELTAENIEKLRERAKKDSTLSPLDLHLSTFVIAYAYAWTCAVKARGGNTNRPVRLRYAADFRQRLDQVPAEYVGNCVLTIGWVEYEARVFLEEDGFIKAVEVISDSVKGLDSRGIESLCEDYVEGRKNLIPGTQFGSVVGSTRLGMYEADFGWGRPTKTMVLSTEEFSMSERRDGAGGVEMGVCLKKSEMEIFLSLFSSGLSD
ncbi:Agmatine coumaroyltransferase [Cardamine amara subsp. amara]|uniref:Agmatine coumaroyltransferase n=1 Tax=Cardamine amara subsp. amara TaxID=228776 RepID=A0ABD1ASV4_CARAN